MQDNTPEKKPEVRKNATGKRLLIALVAIAVVAAGLYFVLREDEAAVLRRQQEAMEQAMKDEEQEVEVEFRVEVDPADLSQAEGLDAAWMNILLLGTDGWGSSLNQGRSDAMLVLSVNEQTGELKLTSLVRDMLVPIPGASRGDRINTANAYGGPLLAIKTVNELLGVNIARYCSVNFLGFAEVVNLLGGVELTLSEGEARLSGAEKSDLPQRLSGYQTLEYSRIRALDNNFGRNERQRKVLNALLEQARGQDRDTVMQAITESLRWMSTNLTAEEALTLAMGALNNQKQLELLSLPPEGKYRFARTQGGASVIEFNQNTVRDAFHQFVYGQDSPDAASDQRKGQQT